MSDGKPDDAYTPHPDGSVYCVACKVTINAAHGMNAPALIERHEAQNPHHHRAGGNRG